MAANSQRCLSAHKTKPRPLSAEEVQRRIAGATEDKSEDDD